jgi:hypothetical protein
LPQNTLNDAIAEPRAPGDVLHGRRPRLEEANEAGLDHRPTARSMDQVGDPKLTVNVGAKLSMKDIASAVELEVGGCRGEAGMQCDRHPIARERRNDRKLITEPEQPFVLCTGRINETIWKVGDCKRLRECHRRPLQAHGKMRAAIEKGFQ